MGEGQARLSLLYIIHPRLRKWQDVPTKLKGAMKLVVALTLTSLVSECCVLYPSRQLVLRTIHARDATWKGKVCNTSFTRNVCWCHTAGVAVNALSGIWWFTLVRSTRLANGGATCARPHSEVTKKQVTVPVRPVIPSVPNLSCHLSTLGFEYM